MILDNYVQRLRVWICREEVEKISLEANSSTSIRDRQGFGKRYIGY